jgi:hypothetical protein
MKKILSIIKKFYKYQKERFPIIVLGLSFLPAVLSSAVVVGTKVSLEFILLALIASLAYLLHVRIIDEFRDYEHDLIHHKDRPLSLGNITLVDLQVVDWPVIFTLIALAVYSSSQAVFIVVAMLLYSFLASKEFFLGLKLRKHFYLYNAVNLVQMLLLQVLVYTLADESFSFTGLVAVHFLFTATGTVIFEFLRKVKSPGQDGTGKDTYTWFLGLKNALLAYSFLATLNIIFYIKIMILTDNMSTAIGLVSVVLILGTTGALLIHKSYKEERTNQLMQLSFMVMYGTFNFLIFLVV